MSKPTKPDGRRKPESEKLSAVILVRAKPAEVIEWRAAADRDGRSLSAWIRWLANKAKRK